MKQQALYIFQNYIIIAFTPDENGRYYKSLGSFSYSKSGNTYVDSNFKNNTNIDLSNYKILGKLSELDEKKASIIFKEVKYSNDLYPDFENDKTEMISTALESLKSYLRFEKWDLNNEIWIAIPKPDSKLTGKKNIVEFDITPESFDRTTVKIQLPVYTSDIKIDTKSINYSIEIPDYLYNFLISHPEINKRPTSKVIKTDVFSKLQGTLDHWNNLANELIQYDRDCKNSKKYIFISFRSYQKDKRDDYQWGYAGKETSIDFQYFIGYQVSNSHNVFVEKRYENGEFVEIPKTQRKVCVHSTSGFKRIEWSDEREEFLQKIESNFKQLSDNLNIYLKDLDSDKLDNLIANNIKLLG